MKQEPDPLVVWARLHGTDRERMMFLKKQERRSYAMLIRLALELYYQSNYESDVPDIVAL